MKTIACWNCGTQIEAGRGRTCACGAFVTPRHDPYVYNRERGTASPGGPLGWFWKCHHCGAEEGPFKLRREADEGAGVHINGSDDL